MKLALLSDIHSNRQALDACLQHARDQGAEHFALLGDLVGYGAHPAYVVQQAMELAAARSGATAAIVAACRAGRCRGAQRARRGAAGPSAAGGGAAPNTAGNL